MKAQADELPKISARKMKKILGDEEKTALAANLVYINDTVEGIERRKNGDKFEYYFQGKKVKDDETLLRIKHLVLPPAWRDVWISPVDNGHLQATGIDAANRKQYKYHHHWVKLRNHTKFYRMTQFGEALPQIRRELEKDLKTRGLSVRKVLATVVSLMERTHIRVGNAFYEKEYGSFGITTLKDKHVHISGSTVDFSFKGKKGVEHEITLKNRRLARIVKQCRDIPGRELFQFYDEDGKRHAIDSGMVNDYIKEISGASFTAKDFRTWAGTVQAFLALKSFGCCDTKAETKRRIVEALDTVSHHLGNTRAVCKKYYVHPLILSLYESKELEKYMNQLDKMENSLDSGLTPEEEIVLKILKAN